MCVSSQSYLLSTSVSLVLLSISLLSTSLSCVLDSDEGGREGGRERGREGEREGKARLGCVQPGRVDEKRMRPESS